MTPDRSLSKPKSVVGTRLRFREATPEDARFILSLRLDPAKNSHLSPVANDIDAQESWLRKSQDDPSQLYFIIEGVEGDRIGTVRLYDPRGDSLCWGSWILTDQAPPSSAIESTLMVYSLIRSLGFARSHFDVRQANTRVWEYHERLGATRTGETEIDYFYSMEPEAIDHFHARFGQRIPDGVVIEF